MKRFILRLLVFFLVGVLALEAIALIRLHPKVYDLWDVKGGWIKVHQRILRAQEPIKGKRLIIGDSVGNQLYEFSDFDFSLASNAAVTMIGQYVLAAEAIKHNPQIEEVVLLAVPNDIGFAFERQLTYNNFVKPFYRLGFFSYFDEIVFKKISARPVSLISFLEAYKLLPVSDVNFGDGAKRVNQSDYVQEMNFEDLSDVSIHYLKKLKELCEEQSIQLLVLSPPVPIHWQEDTYDWKLMKDQIANEDLDPLFANYFEQLVYYPDSLFQDGLHLYPEYLEGARQEIEHKIAAIVTLP